MELAAAGRRTKGRRPGFGVVTMMRMRQLISVLPLAALLGVAAPAAAQPAIVPPGGDPPTAGASSDGVRYTSRLIDAPPPQARAAVTGRTATSSHIYTALDGRHVEVTLSDTFLDTRENEQAAQQYVYFLGSRLHGFELSLLHVFIGTPQEIQTICGGPTVLACYAAGQRRMYIPSRDPANGGPYTRDYAITHEYGHHIAATRRGDPFSALSYGAKYWSAYEHICSRARRRQFFPGNQTTHYLSDPGEGFADTFAHLHYPDVPFQFNPLMGPDPVAFAAIRRDVLTPWRVPRRRVFRSSLGGASFRSYALPFTLDGTLDLRLSGPRGTGFDILVYLDGRLITQTRALGSHDRLIYTLCRPVEAQSLTPVVRVVRRIGAGRFTLYAAYPG